MSSKITNVICELTNSDLLYVNAMRKVKVLSLPETIKEKSTFRAKALRRELVVSSEFVC